MNTTAREPSFFRDWAVSESPQRDLFGDAEAPPTSKIGQYRLNLRKSLRFRKTAKRELERRSG